jgi:hypothetical protein
MSDAGHQPTRRQFLGSIGLVAAAAITASGQSETQPGVPWYRRTYRWGQTNITEADIARYDIAWWREYWKRTATQGVIINAGGIFAYYPSRFPLHHRAAGLGDRDLYGELAAAAHADGLTVLARMDSSKAHEDFYRAHPDWFAQDTGGRPYRSGELYVACLNGPYYENYLPDVLREIIERSHPQGFADNSWSGLDRESICYCKNCSERFGQPLPRTQNWDDPVYRKWIQWSYQRRLQVWDLFNHVTREAGGGDCLWLGMNSGSVTGQSRSFRDVREICGRSQIVLLDHQARSDLGGFADNAITGKLFHGVLGWDKLVPESMPMYQAGRPTFRLSAKPAPEARMWMLSGFAGGIQPWWHHISAYHEDRRAYHTAEPAMQWHRENQKYLVDREPVATIGVIWSQRNTDYFGRDNAEELADQPWRGYTAALVRARIPFVPVHLDDIAREAPKLAALVLPNIGAMSDSQAAAVRKFVQSGGGLVATGQTSLYDAWGEPRSEFALAELFGASGGKPSRALENAARHTYLRMNVERRGSVDGPHVAREPSDAAPRHPALAGFDETDILPFGGTLRPMKVDSKATVLLTFVPSFPAFPPETSWMRTPKTDLPGLIVNEAARGRVAFLPADIDRRFAIDNLPDHGELLANLVRWAANGSLPLDVRGHGLVDCELYRQPDRMILHVVNLTSAGTWRAPVDELIPIGPLQIRVRLDGNAHPKTSKIKRLVASTGEVAKVEDGWVSFELRSITDHELVLIE